MATCHCVAMTRLHVLSCYIKSDHDDIIGNNDAPIKLYIFLVIITKHTANSLPVFLLSKLIANSLPVSLLQLHGNDDLYQSYDTPVSMMSHR